MKRNIITYIGCLLVMLTAFGFAGCESDDIDFANSYPKHISLKCGEKYSLMPEFDENALVIPAAYLDMTYRSENTKIATVNDDMEIVGGNPGTTDIRIYNDDNKLIGSIKVTVIANYSKTIRVGESVNLDTLVGDRYNTGSYVSLNESIIAIEYNNRGYKVAVGKKPGTTCVIYTKLGYETTRIAIQFTVTE